MTLFAGLHKHRIEMWHAAQLHTLTHTQLNVLMFERMVQTLGGSFATDVYVAYMKSLLFM